MKYKRLWWVLLIMGILPFVIPFIGYVYEIINSSSWKLFDWLVLYSFVYWPTYIIDIVLVLVSIIVNLSNQ